MKLSEEAMTVVIFRKLNSPECAIRLPSGVQRRRKIFTVPLAKRDRMSLPNRVCVLRRCEREGAREEERGAKRRNKERRGNARVCVRAFTAKTMREAVRGSRRIVSRKRQFISTRVAREPRRCHVGEQK